MRSALALLTRKRNWEASKLGVRVNTKQILTKTQDFTVQDINKTCVHLWLLYARATTRKVIAYNGTGQNIHTLWWCRMILEWRECHIVSESHNWMVQSIILIGASLWPSDLKRIIWMGSINNLKKDKEMSTSQNGTFCVNCNPKITKKNFLFSLMGWMKEPREITTRARC